MEFEDWAEQYALDDEPCTRQSRRQDCAAAWEASAAATRKTCEVACSQALEYARGDEREQCAAVCETKANENADKWEGDEAKAASWMMLQCAAAIRKRSNG